VSGHRSYYLRGAGARLQFALQNFTMDLLQKLVSMFLSISVIWNNVSTHEWYIIKPVTYYLKKKKKKVNQINFDFI